MNRLVQVNISKGWWLCILALLASPPGISAARRAAHPRVAEQSVRLREQTAPKSRPSKSKGVGAKSVLLFEETIKTVREIIVIVKEVLSHTLHPRTWVRAVIYTVFFAMISAGLTGVREKITALSQLDLTKAWGEVAKPFLKYYTIIIMPVVLKECVDRSLLKSKRAGEFSAIVRIIRTVLFWVSFAYFATPSTLNPLFLLATSVIVLVFCELVADPPPQKQPQHKGVAGAMQKLVSGVIYGSFVFLILYLANELVSSPEIFVGNLHDPPAVMWHFLRDSSWFTWALAFWSWIKFTNSSNEWFDPLQPVRDYWNNKIVATITVPLTHLIHENPRCPLAYLINALCLNVFFA